VSALTFLSAWTRRLHGLGYRSGVYSSATSGIRALDRARILAPGRFTLPDQVWVADWDGRASVTSRHLHSGGWLPHARIHQYLGTHDETYGGVRLSVDSDFMDLGRGSVAPRARPWDGGTPVLKVGSVGDAVRHLQELLRLGAPGSGRDPRGVFGPATRAAVTAFQRRHSLAPTGVVTDPTWRLLAGAGP
jgi:hypothetical protein